MDFVQFRIFAAMEKSERGTAVVVKHTGSHYLLSQLPRWDLFPAVVRGKLRLKESSSTNPVAVGDIVDFERDDHGTASIMEVRPRRNYVIRKSVNLSREAHIIAANVSQAFLVVTLDFPETKWAFIDRFLVTCEAYKVPVKIVLNKIDLYGGCEMAEYFKEVYSGAGYEVLEVSALTGEGIDLLRAECSPTHTSHGQGSAVSRLVAGQTSESLSDGFPPAHTSHSQGSAEPFVSLFSGVSGVGKSSLMKALDPSLGPKIAEISEHYQQGRHTTTFYEMYPLSTGGFIIDTPGIRGFGLVDFEQEELSTYFPEMFRVMDSCKYKPCTHTHEPGCAVKAAADEGKISPERYNSYLGMLEEGGKYR